MKNILNYVDSCPKPHTFQRRAGPYHSFMQPSGFEKKLYLVLVKKMILFNEKATKKKKAIEKASSN